MAIENVKGSLEYSKDLQSAMASNPLKKETMSETQRQKNIQEAASKIDVKALMASYVMEFQMNIGDASENNFNSQNGVSLLGGSALSDSDRLMSILNGLDLNAIGYRGKPLQELTSSEAKALMAEDGFFGIAKTSARIADFVIAGAGDDVEKLKAGREGIIRGYNQAQKAWGGELPDISKETLQKSLEKIDKRLTELGVNVLEENV